MGASSLADCKDCLPGTYNPLTGSVTPQACLRCPMGSWGSVARATMVEQCRLCPAGTYGTAAGATSNTSCVPCPAGTFNDVAGAAGAEACQNCLAGTFNMMPGAGHRTSCRPCPVGAVCTGRDPPYAAPGSWYSGESPTVFVRCTPPEACRGGDLRALQNGSMGTEALCEAAYAGERCSECARQHYRFGGHCRPCPRNTLLFILLCAAALVGALMMAHVLLKLAINLAPLTIAVDYFQVLSNVGRFDVHWPEAPRSMLSMFALMDLNVDAAAPECFVGVNFTRDWAMVASLPFVCAGLLALYHLAWRCSQGRSAPTARVRRHRESRVGEMLLLLQVTYLPIAGKALQLFNCTRLANGDNVLVVAPYIQCWRRDSEHSRLAVMGLLAVVLYVAGIPLLFWRVLRWARRQEKKWLAAAPAVLRPYAISALAGSPSGLSAEQLAAWLAARRGIRIAGNLRQRFRPGKGLWLLLVMARRLALGCAFVFLYSQPQTQIVMVALVQLVALELQHRYKPYVDSATQARRRKASVAAESHVEDEDKVKQPAEVELGQNPMWRSKHSLKQQDAVRTQRIAAVQRFRRGMMVARQRDSTRQPVTPSAPAWWLKRVVAAAEDANAMEWVALVSSLLVLLSALMYHAARREIVTGTETHTLNVQLFVTDALCVTLLMATCTYMTVVSAAPLLRAAWRAARRQCSQSRLRQR